MLLSLSLSHFLAQEQELFVSRDQLGIDKLVKLAGSPPAGRSDVVLDCIGGSLSRQASTGN